MANFDKPVHKGQVFHNIPVTETSTRGSGVARIQGLVIFIANTVVGDRVDIIINRVGANYAEAEVLHKA